MTRIDTDKRAAEVLAALGPKKALLSWVSSYFDELDIEVNASFAGVRLNCLTMQWPRRFDLSGQRMVNVDWKKKEGEWEVRTVRRWRRDCFVEVNRGDDGSQIIVKPNEREAYFMGELIDTLLPGLERLDQVHQPLGTPIDCRMLGGGLVVNFDGDGSWDISLVCEAEEALWILEVEKGDRSGDLLLDRLVRYLVGVFGLAKGFGA